MIRNNEIQDGDKLPNQMDLASQLGVSRTALREAFSKLSMVGAVYQKPGVGTILISKHSALNTDTVTPPLMSDSEAASELIQARSVLEVGAAPLAATNATESQIEELGNIIKDMKNALDYGDVQKYIESDIAFHHKIISSTQNRFIIYSYKNMQGYIEQYIQECMNLIPKMQQISLSYHIGIYEAIKSRDAAETEQKMRNHIDDIKYNYRKYFMGFNTS
jgi:GntR family transcriptional repressor for pyruvate dehydrogenase complex